MTDWSEGKTPRRATLWLGQPPSEDEAAACEAVVAALEAALDHPSVARHGEIARLDALISLYVSQAVHLLGAERTAANLRAAAEGVPQAARLIAAAPEGSG